MINENIADFNGFDISDALEVAFPPIPTGFEVMGGTVTMDDHTKILTLPKGIDLDNKINSVNGVEVVYMTQGDEGILKAKLPEDIIGVDPVAWGQQAIPSIPILAANQVYSEYQEFCEANPQLIAAFTEQGSNIKDFFALNNRTYQLIFIVPSVENNHG